MNAEYVCTARSKNEVQTQVFRLAQSNADYVRQINILKYQVMEANEKYSSLSNEMLMKDQTLTDYEHEIQSLKKQIGLL